MDPHEEVSMDAEEIMSNTWDFEFMVKKTLTKTCSNDEIPYHTPFARPQFEYIKNISKIKNPITSIK